MAEAVSSEHAPDTDNTDNGGIVSEILLDYFRDPSAVREFMSEDINRGSSAQGVDARVFNKDYNFLLMGLRESIEKIFEDGIKSFKKMVSNRRKEILEWKDYKIKYDGYTHVLKTGYLRVYIEDYWNAVANPFYCTETMHYPSCFKDFLEKNSILLTEETPVPFLQRFGGFFDGYLKKYVRGRVNDAEDIVNFKSSVRASDKDRLVDNICYRLSIKRQIDELCSKEMIDQEDQAANAKLTWENYDGKVQKLMDETLKNALAHLDDSQDGDVS